MGGLYYPNQITQVIFGSKSETTRTGVELESTYQTESANTEATKTFPCKGMSKLNIDILYTEGASETTNSIQVIIEGTTDGTNFYRLPNDSTSGATSTITAREFTFVGADGAAASISIGIDIFYTNLRISAKESGVASNKGNIFAEVTLSGR